MRIDEQGNQRPLSPGEVGQTDQLTAEFKDLTVALMQIHMRLAGIAQEVDGESSPEQADRLKAVRKDLFDVLSEAFISGGNPEKVFNYLMFLVDIVSTYETQRHQVGVHLNKAAAAVNDLAQAVGMEPATGGGDR